MNAQQYAAAILKASRNKGDEELDGVVTRVVSLLEERGHRSLLPTILHELQKLYKREAYKNECLIRVATQNEAEHNQQEIKETVQKLQAAELPLRLEVDDTLIGGYEVRANGKRVDKTYKRNLLHLYNTLLTNN